MDESSKSLVESWRNGDDTAAAQLFDRYFQRLLNLVDNRLAKVFRSRFDAADVCQSAMRSVFRRTKETEVDFDHDGGVWSFIAQVALNKLKTRCRREVAGRRDIRRELPQNAEEEAVDELFQGLSREPSGEEVTMFRNLLNDVMDRLAPEERQFLTMQLHGGYSQQEIARELNVCTRTVRRLPIRIRERLSDLLEAN